MKKIFLTSFLFLFATFAIAASSPFQLSTGLITPEGIQLNWTIQKNAYLYQKFIKVTSLNPAIQVGTPIFPEGEIKNTKLFGQVIVYHDALSLNIPIENPEHQSQIALQLSYQGCSEQGQCFPPVTEVLNIDFSTKLASSSSIFAKNTPNNDTQQIKETLQQHSLVFIFTAFFIFGLFLSVTPCVLPMIPILSSIILQGYNKKNPSKLKAFSLSVAYVLGMAIAYASLGFLMSLVGNHIQAFLQNFYSLLFFSIIFILLALSLLGVFEIQWTKVSNNKLTELNQKLAQIACKNHFTVFIMGFLSSLIVSPCITPPLVGALSYITATGNMTIGTAALFCMGLGLGLPLLFIGALSNAILPKVGPWMNGIKFIMGLLLLSIAFFLLQRILPHHITTLWAVFALVVFILLLYRVNFSTPWRRIIFQIFCFFGIVGSGLIVIQHIFPSQASESTPYIMIVNTQQLNHTLNLAKQTKKPILIDFYADWCPDCQMMDATVFSHADILKLLKNFVWIKVDMTKDSSDIWALQEKYHVSGPPTFLFYTSNGKHLKQFDFVGIKSKEEVSAVLTKINQLNLNQPSVKIAQ